jgi:hypothetical protein
MQAPPLHIIQASTILSSLLVCSQDDTAFKFATVHNARRVSVSLKGLLCPVLVLFVSVNSVHYLPTGILFVNQMAERAKLFDPVDAIDYSCLSESDFDWHSWIYQETRRRQVP